MPAAVTKNTTDDALIFCSDFENFKTSDYDGVVFTNADGDTVIGAYSGNGRLLILIEEEGGLVARGYEAEVYPIRRAPSTTTVTFQN